MLNFRLLDTHDDTGGSVSEIAPFMIAENTKGLSDGFEDALRANLDRVLDALRIAAGDPAGADGHGPESIIFTFCSPFTLAMQIVCYNVLYIGLWVPPHNFATGTANVVFNFCLRIEGRSSKRPR
jgi:hypothetical protein